MFSPTVPKELTQKSVQDVIPLGPSFPGQICAVLGIHIGDR